MMTFSEKLLKVRATLMLTQVKLAEELDISFSTLNRWERGHYEPCFLARVRFDNYCKAKGVTFDEDKNGGNS